MRRWFLSYNSQDLALMEALEVALRRKDPESQIFFAPKSLRAGSYWLPRLADEIARANVFVLLVGGKGVGRWQVDEYYEARDKRVPVILVLLEGQSAPGLPFLRTLHWIVTPDPTSESSLARLMDAAGPDAAPADELWRYSAPYRGLAVMTEVDSDFFFGRCGETVEIIKALARMPDKIPVLLGNSGVGKSSLALAGVRAALARQKWPETAGDAGHWPPSFQNSRQWCFLTAKPGAEPISALVEAFLDVWQFHAGDPARIRQRNEWKELLLDERKTTKLSDLIDETERRLKELERPTPPIFFLYVDQGEELYIRSEARQRRRFSEIIAQGVADSRVRVMMSMRSDFLGDLQNDEALFNAHHKIDVPPLRDERLRDIVSRPAEFLSARFETDHLAADIARHAAEESRRHAGALPLLSYLLDDMWTEMVKRGDGILRLPAEALKPGGVLAERANAFLADHPKSEDALRRLLTLKLATVREDGEPTRRRALRSEFTDEEWRLVYELANHPNRLIVTITPENGETYAEVAHEAIFWRWKTLRDWISAEREFLIWKSNLERDRYAWATTGAKGDALLMGYKLAQAQGWLSARARDLSGPDRQFIEQSVRRDALDRAQRERLRRRTRQMAALASVLVFGVGVVLAWSNLDYLEAHAVTVADAIFPQVLGAEDERALEPGQSFRECAHCPEMVAVSAGGFTMGSTANEPFHRADEEPWHFVMIPTPFAVSRFEVTSEEWDACVLLGGCSWPASDTGWGRGKRPVMNVNWDDAQQYVAWLRNRTGKHYRLLSESEWEYAARAGSDKAYSWGDDVRKDGKLMANWDGRLTTPVGLFDANAFGLHDLHGNVWEWVEDCWHTNYEGAPSDGSAWTAEACETHVTRGGSWDLLPEYARAASRVGYNTGVRGLNLGFRIARTLSP